MRMTIALLAMACTSSSDSQEPTFTDAVTPDDATGGMPLGPTCQSPPSSSPGPYSDMGLHSRGCFSEEMRDLEFVTTPHELNELSLCDTAWAADFDWAGEYLVVGAASSCGTVLLSADYSTDFGVDVRLYALHICQSPLDVVHVVGLPRDVDGGYSLTICND